MSDRRSTGRYSRNKGKRYEREVSNFLKAVFPKAARGKSQSVHDETFRPDVDGLPDHWVECKHRKRVNLREALLQGEAEAASVGDRRRAVVFAKDDTIGGKKSEWVMMRPETFLALCEAAYNGGSGYDVQTIEEAKKVCSELADLLDQCK